MPEDEQTVLPTRSSTEYSNTGVPTPNSGGFRPLGIEDRQGPGSLWTLESVTSGLILSVATSELCFAVVQRDNQSWRIVYFVYVSHNV
jgi:hypothetical protein